jgi:hypothetical protein
MTEAQEQHTEQEAASPYEKLRDSAPKVARVEWADGDRWARHVREQLQKLANDEELSDKGKHERAQYHLGVATTKIERGYTKAAALLEKEAKRAELASVPLPDGHDLNTKVKDNDGLLAIQGETQAIVSKVEARREKMPKGMKAPDPAPDVLRDIYAAAMEDGGVEGMARARGALRAAEQLGVPVDDVVAPFMEREHYEAADEARRLSYLAKQVPSPKSMIPANPFAPESKPKGEYHTRSASANVFKPRSPSTTTDSGPRRRPWK